MSSTRIAEIRAANHQGDVSHDDIEHLCREIERLHTGVTNLRNAIHACNRNPIPNRSRMEWRDMCDALLKMPPSRDTGEDHERD